MPQDGSGNYDYPLGTRGIPDETIESAAYNNFIDDLRDNDLNKPRPIHRGGTGAINADAALVNLSAEKAAQLVTPSYDAHVWYPGSFRSTNAPGQSAPVDGHAFSGICYINEPLANPPTNANVVVSARDLDDTVVPSRVYVREKKANVWGAWTVIDATTLPFPPSGSISGDTIIEAIQELDTETAAAIAAANVNANSRVLKAGDTMTGFLTLNANPTAALHAVTKQYVDAAVAAVSNVLPYSTPLRFNRASAQYMNRVFGITSSQPWTMSMWVKRVALGTHQALFGSNVPTNTLHVGFSTSNYVSLFGGAGGVAEAAISTAPITDPNTWINIIWASPTASTAPATKNATFYVNNGAAVNAVVNDPSLNTGGGVPHFIGQPPSFHPDVIMKEVIFVDGAALTPTSFGANVGGVWTPIIYPGAYGANGFKLSFSNPFPPANLGIDSSGNGNHWTPVNF